MHPVLVEIPFPRWNVALTPWLLAVSLLSVGVCELARRSRSRELFLVGVAGCLTALLAAALHRGERMEIGPMPVYSFGALLSAAVLAGWTVTVRIARLDGLPQKATAAACLAATLGGFAGARLLYVATNSKDFHSVADVLAFQGGGLTFYGAVIAGALGSYWPLRRRTVSWLCFADAAAPGIALSSGIGRIGCYLAGCDYGTPLADGAPAWLKRLGTFPRWSDDVAGAAAGSPAWVDHVLYRGLSLGSKASLPVHPTELYEATAALALFAGLLTLRRRRLRVHPFIVLVVGYAIVRFPLEIVRGDPERGVWGPLSASQWIAVASLGAAALVSRLSSPPRHTALPG